MATKTNAVRLVQQAGIPCREAFYEFDEQDLSGGHAAQAIGMPEEQVFKTLVARGEKTGINVFCIPVCCELDLKKAAKAAQADERVLWDAKSASSEEKLKKAGVEFITVDKKPFYEATAAVRAKYGAPYADMIKRIDAVQ